MVYTMNAFLFWFNFSLSSFILCHKILAKSRKALPVISFNEFVCELCHHGEHSRSSYLSHDVISSNIPFDLIH